MLTIGEVTGVHGLRGKLKVKSFATSAEPFSQGKKLFLEKKGEKRNCTSAGASVSRKGIFLSLEEVQTVDAAEELVGYTILISKGQLPPLEENTWYWQDLYGLEVVDAQRGMIGKITSILETGASDVFIVQNAATGKETMIPMHEKFVLSVDVPAGQVYTDLPEGL